MYHFDRERRVRKINKMQSQAESVKEEQENEEKIKKTKNKNIFLKNKEYYPQNFENLWNKKGRFSQKHLKFYHIPNDASNKKYNQNLQRQILRDKTLKFELKKKRFLENQAESKETFKKRILERTALQKVSNQYVADINKSAVNQLKMLNNSTTFDLARAKTRPNSAMFLKKPGFSWNDYRKKDDKYVNSEFTSKVIDGEDMAVKMINNRIDDQIRAQSMILERKKKFRLNEMDKRKDKSNEKNSSGNNSEFKIKNKNSLKRSQSEINYKKEEKFDIKVEEVCREFGNYHEEMLQDEGNSGKKLALKRIDYYEEFRNMPIRDTRARSALIKDNNYIEKIKKESEFASEPLTSKRKIKGRKEKKKLFFGKSLDIKKKGEKNRESGQIIRPYTAQSLKGRGKYTKNKPPFLRKYMSKEAEYRENIKPILKDRIEDNDIVNPLNLKNVKSLFFLIFYRTL